MKKSYIIGLILIAVAFSVIISTVSNSSTYASFSTAASHEGKVFHVVGKVNKEKPFEYNPEKNANLFIFYMTDNEGTGRKVLYNGTKPQDFEKSEQIVTVGKISGDEFHASEILMKCPSKYTGNNVQTKSS